VKNVLEAELFGRKIYRAYHKEDKEDRIWPYNGVFGQCSTCTGQYIVGLTDDGTLEVTALQMSDKQLQSEARAEEFGVSIQQAPWA
jgi:hypothetical protein